MQVTAALQKSTLAAALALATLSTSVSANQIEDKPSAAAIVADAAIARPAYIILSQAGALVYGATLPLTLLTGSADAVAETLVVTPLQQGFLRCLGCRKIETEVSRMEEGDGKTIQHFVQLNAGYNMFKDKSLDEIDNSFGAGVALGTHFLLSDTSRFDVMLGARYLGAPEYEDFDVEDQVLSYQITSRFGRAISDGIDIMGKLGLHQWQANWENTNTGADGSAGGNGIFYGIGLDFRMNDKMRSGVEYTHYTLEDGGYEVDVDTIDFTVALMF